MKILLASSEIHPFSKTGGLADMVGALGKALARAGHEVLVVTPLYAGIREQFSEITPESRRLDLPLGPHRVQAQTASLKTRDGVNICFIDQPGFYDRAALYQESGSDYSDNAERFIFFSKAVADIALDPAWPPDVVHVHDWQAGLVPLLIRQAAKESAYRHKLGCCLTIHNLAYQGVFPADRFALTNLPGEDFTPAGVEFFGQLNCLKAGVVGADVITTVSPRYAREIMTEELGCGLDGLLRSRRETLFGILNGVDYDEWNTRVNPYLAASYSQEDLSGKLSCKAALQQELGLTVDAAVPLFATISRLVDQKGMDIELGSLEEMLASGLQFVLLGTGAPVFERAFLDLARRYPVNVAARIGYAQGLSHRIEAGADFYLMPSRFEPCGLNQMYSLRYGAIPIVRVTGGLDDTVVDLTENRQRANGIKFTEYSPRALSKAIRKALALYREPELLRHYRRNAMAADFSWSQTASQYLGLYERLVER